MSSGAVIRRYAGKVPRLGRDVFLADNAVVIGDVEIGDDSSVWFGTVLRGDVGWIRIGGRCNVQDLSTVHTSTGISNTEIEDDVTIGHGVIVHGARICRGALIGMGSILLDNVTIGERALVGAGSLVPARMQVPPRVLVFGRPARVVRELDQDEIEKQSQIALHYVDIAHKHRTS
jgi:carbonic anhydrase/acetyltransferase-like protein (isoleucine patch superfamily)